MKKVSIIIPFLNEEQNLTILYNEIIEVLHNVPFEIIYIDDGSTDNCFNEMKYWSSKS